MQHMPEWQTHLDYWNTKITDDKESVFAININEQHIGNCGIKPIPRTNDNEVWIYLEDNSTRRVGIAETAMHYLLKFVLKDLGLKRLFLHVKSSNKPAIGLYQKLGFSISSDSIDKAIWNNSTYDVIKMVRNF